MSYTIIHKMINSRAVLYNNYKIYMYTSTTHTHIYTHIKSESIHHSIIHTMGCYERLLRLDFFLAGVVLPGLVAAAGEEEGEGEGLALYWITQAVLSHSVTFSSDCVTTSGNVGVAWTGELPSDAVDFASGCGSILGASSVSDVRE